MASRCKQKDCFAPKGLCVERLDHEYKKCDHWLAAAQTDAKEKAGVDGVGQPLPWSGEAFEPKDISLVSSRSNPVIIGMVGTADAGKTSHLAMLFRLLFNGHHFDGWKFSGSYTLSAWETLAQYMMIRSGAKVTFPPPTPSNPDFYSLYHLALRHSDWFRDILFADSSGEVFLRWANDIRDPGAENARWIYKHSSAFVFFVDCEALSTGKGAALRKIEQMALQLAVALGNRPVVVVWSKADKKQEIKKTVREALQDSLKNILPAAIHLDVSNISRSDEDPNCHMNNLLVVTHLLSAISREDTCRADTERLPTEDYFLLYKGNYATGE